MSAADAYNAAGDASGSAGAPPASAAPASADVKPAVSDTTLTIRVKDQSGEETFFKVKTSTKMGKVFGAFAKRKGVESAAMRFIYDGRRVANDETPESLDMEDQDQVDCFLEQTGGSGRRC